MRIHKVMSVTILSLLTFQCGDEGERRHFKAIGNAAWSPTTMNAILISKTEYDFVVGKRSGCGTDVETASEPSLPDYELFIADTSAAITKQLTSNLRLFQHKFAWSPKGDKFVVWTEYDPPMRIIDTMGNVTIIDSLANTFDLDWSPGGGEILIAGRKFGASQSHLFVYTLHGTLSQWSDTIVPGHVSWSPDGRIAAQCFKDSSWPGGAVTKSYLAVLSPYENVFRRIYEFRAGTNELRWSPDGRKILFSDRAESTSSFQLFEIPFDGGTTRVLTANTDDSQPYSFSYSPDGSSIEFLEYNTTASSLYVIDSDGNSKRFIASTRTPGSWSPDSRRVAYVYNNNLYAAEIK
ncbi:MAG: PD40 domain-containing protein [Ignavibacteriae bacterium]|nr:PD40 domain-containing protein [Ignavibacteriota bacterium]